MTKLTKRKGFNFFRSYYDVYNELDDADKVAFMDALLDRQFLGIKPKELTGMAKFAYISQTNSIDSQVKGYNDKAKSLNRPLLGDSQDPPIAPPHGGLTPPPQQEKEKEKEKEEEKGKEKEVLDIKKVKTFSKEIYEACNSILRFFPEDLWPKNLSQKINWWDTLEKLNRIDGWELKNIEAVVYKTRADDFWRKNFLSLTKLRKKDKNGIMYIDVFYNNFRIDLNGPDSAEKKKQRLSEIFNAMNKN